MRAELKSILNDYFDVCFEVEGVYAIPWRWTANAVLADTLYAIRQLLPPHSLLLTLSTYFLLQLQIFSSPLSLQNRVVV